MDNTRKFSLKTDRHDEISQMLSKVYMALDEKGYNPIEQIVGYIITEDPTYITNHEGARSLIRRVDRFELLKELLTYYLLDSNNT